MIETELRIGVEMDTPFGPIKATLDEVGVESFEFPDDMPEELRDILRQHIEGHRNLSPEEREERRKLAVARDFAEHVTPQIANEILSQYGDPDALSQPSLATSALISLIRTCHISDDEMLSEINDVESFHGYVLGIVYMAEGPDGSGMKMLRYIAGIDKDPNE